MCSMPLRAPQQQGLAPRKLAFLGWEYGGFRGLAGASKTSRRHERPRAVPEVALTLASILVRTKQELVEVSRCVTTFHPVQKVSSFRRLALKEQAGQGVGF